MFGPYFPHALKMLNLYAEYRMGECENKSLRARRVPHDISIQYARPVVAEIHAPFMQGYMIEETGTTWIFSF